MENNRGKWVPLPVSAAFLFCHIRLVIWSSLLVAMTGLFTWMGYHEAIHLVDGLVGNFFQSAPVHHGLWGWSIFIVWFVGKYLFLFVSRTTSFYLAFLMAYCLTTPGYVFLSGSAERLYLGKSAQSTGRFSLVTMLVDLWEGLKIGAVGILVTVVALALNFLPVVGQILAMLLYIFYSALMFVDYPASNQHWTLGQKLNWLRINRGRAFRLGLLPAFISMIPVINIVVMALFFPLFTVHTTLNFVTNRGASEDGVISPL